MQIQIVPRNADERIALETAQSVRIFYKAPGSEEIQEAQVPTRIINPAVAALPPKSVGLSTPYDPYSDTIYSDYQTGPGSLAEKSAEQMRNLKSKYDEEHRKLLQSAAPPPKPKIDLELDDALFANMEIRLNDPDLSLDGIYSNWYPVSDGMQLQCSDRAELVNQGVDIDDEEDIVVANEEIEAINADEEEIDALINQSRKP